jgi:DNA-binding beta-propeller fold protein YncE
MRLEDDLRRALEEEVAGVRSSEDAWRSIEGRLGQQAGGRRGSRVAAIVLALTLSIASLVGLWLGFRSVEVDREVTPREPPEVTPTAPKLRPRVAAVVPVGPFPQEVAVGEGAVWVSVPAQWPDEDDFVVRVDPATNEVVARIRVEDPLDDLTAGEGGVWGVGAKGSGPPYTLYVARIDPARDEVVATIRDVSGPLAVADSALWAVDRAGALAGPEGSTLLRIDPATNDVVASVPLGVAAWDLEAGDGYLWVLSFEPDPGEGDILQVDPVTSEVVARIEIPYAGSVFAPAVGEGSAWVPVCCDDNKLMLVRIDVGTSSIIGEPITVGAGGPFAVAAGHVWFVDERGGLHGLNTATSQVDEEVSMGEWPVGVAPDPAAELDHGALVAWIANYQDSVTRIDLASPAG